MSKGSEFWGVASGKLGQQVLYRAGGEQRARAYVAKIKNPKTMAQMKNRILMNNVVSAFHAMKPLLQASFPNRKSNQSAFNAFVQANKQKNQYYISKEDVEHTACVPYGMQIAKGNVGLTITPTLAELTNARDPEAAPKYGWCVDGLLDLNGFEMTLDDTRASNSVVILSEEELFDVFSSRCLVQLPSEFTLSLVAAPYGEEDEDLSTDIWQFGYKVTHCQKYNGYSRLYGIARNFRGLQIGLHISEVTEIGSTNTWKAKFDKLVISVSYVLPDGAFMNPCGLILSYKDASGQQTLNSYISSVPARFNDEAVEDPTADYRWGGFYAMQVLDQYGYKANDILTSENLNIAPESGADDEQGGGDLGA